MTDITTPNWAAAARAAGTAGAILRGEAAVISFKEDGTVEMMQDDNINIGILGEQHIRRATEIRWNQGTQSWDIELLLYNDGSDTVRETLVPLGGAGFAAYSVARAAEVRWLSLARAAGVEPASITGCWLLYQAREAVFGYST